MRVVADTNVYISALVFGGKPREFLERAREGEFELAVSEDIIAEVAHVLRDRFGWPASDVGDATVITADPDDDRILECAAAARAERIVSRDLDLRRLGAFRGIPILTLAEFMTQLEGS